MPPKRARVLDASVTTVRHESETTKRYARSGELAGGELKLPTPRDNGSPGPSSGRPAGIRVDPESGMLVEERHRVRVVPEISGEGEADAIVDDQASRLAGAGSSLTEAVSRFVRDGREHLAVGNRG